MSFKVISWNILADAYIKTSYYPNVPPEALEPAGRRARLLDTLEAQQADLYLLQEVEPDAFQAITARLGAGFEAHLAQKPGRPEGVALLARRSAVTIQQRETLVYEARNNGAPVALLALLQIEGRALAVASTHLEWSPDDTPAHAHTGRRQLAELLAQRGRFAPAGTPWLLGGDLNATSQSPPWSWPTPRGCSSAAAPSDPGTPATSTDAAASSTTCSSPQARSTRAPDGCRA